MARLVLTATLRLETGRVIDSVSEKSPLVVDLERDQGLFPPVRKLLKNLSAGESFEVSVSSREWLKLAADPRPEGEAALELERSFFPAWFPLVADQEVWLRPGPGPSGWEFLWWDRPLADFAGAGCFRVWEVGPERVKLGHWPLEMTPQLVWAGRVLEGR